MYTLRPSNMFMLLNIFKVNGRISMTLAIHLNNFFLMQQVTLIQSGKQRGGLKCFPWSRRKCSQITGIKNRHVLSPVFSLKAEHNREKILSFPYTHLNLTNKQETATRELLRNQDMDLETHLLFFSTCLLFKITSRCFLQTSN